MLIELREHVDGPVAEQPLTLNHCSNRSDQRTKIRYRERVASCCQHGVITVVGCISQGAA